MLKINTALIIALSAPLIGCGSGGGGSDDKKPSTNSSSSSSSSVVPGAPIKMLSKAEAVEFVLQALFFDESDYEPKHSASFTLIPKLKPTLKETPEIKIGQCGSGSYSTTYRYDIAAYMEVTYDSCAYSADQEGVSATNEGDYETPEGFKAIFDGTVKWAPYGFTDTTYGIKISYEPESEIAMIADVIVSRSDKTGTVSSLTEPGAELTKVTRQLEYAIAKEANGKPARFQPDYIDYKQTWLTTSDSITLTMEGEASPILHGNNYHYTVETITPIGIVSGNYQGHIKVSFDYATLDLLVTNEDYASISVDADNNGVTDYSFDSDIIWMKK